MFDWLTNNEGLLRFAVSLCVLAVLLVIETRWSRRVMPEGRGSHRGANIIIVLIDSLLVRLFFAAWIPANLALWAQDHQWGLLHWVGVPLGIATLISLLFLDGLIYWQHRLTHRWPWLWRLHRMHHTDTHVDVTTALRFHPLEIILSLFIKCAAVLLMGVPLVAVVIFEVILNGMALFNHSNLRVPLGLDAHLRRWLVTPDMHRVHHSVVGKEHNSNFGFNLSCWDRWFGSYQSQPEAGHEQMILGLNETNQQQTGSVVWMLKQPFV